jgi:hypothetical protein
MTQTQTKYRNKLRPTKRATTDFKKWIGFTHKMLDLADLVAVRLSCILALFGKKNDYQVSYPGNLPGMLNPPLEPARWLWSSLYNLVLFGKKRLQSVISWYFTLV